MKKACRAGFGVIALLASSTLVGARAHASPTLNGSSPQSFAPLRWKVFRSSEVGLSFRFPTPPGTIEYRYSQCGRPDEGCDGPYYSWEITRTDVIDRGHSYWFAGYTAHENNGRELWPTDIASWGHDKIGYWASDGYTKFRVQAVEVLTISDGSKVLIFKPGDISCAPSCSAANFPYLKDRLAVINFARPRKGFRDLVLYFEDATPLRAIEQSVRSVSFETLPDTGVGLLPLIASGFGSIAIGLTLWASRSRKGRRDPA